MSSDPTQQAHNAATAMKTIFEVAAKSPELTDAGLNIAKVAQTVTALVNNCLLPIAAVNFAFDKGRQYFSQQFQLDLEAATKDIPAELITEPKASLAAPILQGLTFAHEEPELKRLFLNLLKSSMDSRVSAITHPAFVEVIKQLNSEEARLLRTILSSSNILPIVEIRQKFNEAGGYLVIKSNVMSTNDISSKQPMVLARMSAMVDNWRRLGLVNVSYLEQISESDNYAWVDTRPEYIEAVEKHESQNIEVQKGILEVTSFGREFAIAVN